MGFGVVHCCYYDKIYLQLIDMGGLRLQRAIVIAVLLSLLLHFISLYGALVVLVFLSGLLALLIWLPFLPYAYYI